MGTAGDLEHPVSGAPASSTPVPPVLARVTGGRPLEPVWRNELGGLTFRVVGAGQYVKHSPAGSGIDLAREAARLRWAGRSTAVPRVIDTGEDASGQWLLTAALPGSNAVAPYWRTQPARAVPALGRALRAVHDALPVQGCPFVWEPEVARTGGPARPPVLRPVVCHGDACAPNTLLADDPPGGAGASSGPAVVTGVVDLGQLGVGDPWADLAIATWSTRWNYGPGWEQALLEAHGTELDAERTAYYRWLWGTAPPDAPG